MVFDPIANFLICEMRVAPTAPNSHGYSED